LDKIVDRSMNWSGVITAKVVSTVVWLSVVNKILKSRSWVVKVKNVLLLVLSGVHVGKRVDDVSVKFWLVIIQDLLGWVNWRWLELEVPLVSNDILSNLNAVGVIENVIVNSIVWDWVVHWVSSSLLWVLVLGASGR